MGMGENGAGRVTYTRGAILTNALNPLHPTWPTLGPVPERINTSHVGTPSPTNFPTASRAAQLSGRVITGGGAICAFSDSTWRCTDWSPPRKKTCPSRAVSPTAARSQRLNERGRVQARPTGEFMVIELVLKQYIDQNNEWPYESKKGTLPSLLAYHCKGNIYADTQPKANDEQYQSKCSKARNQEVKHQPTQ
ncbi:hypothetical protein SAMN00790413_00820 [Deinococcus hopiensis KR-140]|uniref:Uncharacterized protein n=1 Tax=Deinococcus hopiensis KR-140 TaxID=695939 RepID=A0A1W1VAZ5_9DEIO|nr:hypothetical protein SAMN00790413_00820 [Deinococcus hopiensis KR-140]